MIVGEKHSVNNTDFLIPFNSPSRSILRASTSSLAKEKNNQRSGTVEREIKARKSSYKVGLACLTHLPHISVLSTIMSSWYVSSFKVLWGFYI